MGVCRAASRRRVERAHRVAAYRAARSPRGGCAAPRARFAETRQHAASFVERARQSEARLGILGTRGLQRSPVQNRRAGRVGGAPRVAAIEEEARQQDARRRQIGSRSPAAPAHPRRRARVSSAIARRSSASARLGWPCRFRVSASCISTRARCATSTLGAFGLGNGVERVRDRARQIGDDVESIRGLELLLEIAEHEVDERLAALARALGGVALASRPRGLHQGDGGAGGERQRSGRARGHHDAVPARELPRPDRPASSGRARTGRCSRWRREDRRRRPRPRDSAVRARAPAPCRRRCRGRRAAVIPSAGRPPRCRRSRRRACSVVAAFELDRVRVGRAAGLAPARRGGACASSSKASAPRPQTSVAVVVGAPASLFGRCVEGSQRAHHAASSVAAADSGVRILAMPKSRSFTSPLAETITLDGLRSRWTTRLRCA